ncbi:MAG TPA: glycosyltransferase family 4 protein [Anaerolineales bacterium]
MRILFVADGRSPIALNWIAYFVEQGHEVHLASTFPAQPNLALASLEIVPTAFSSLKANNASNKVKKRETGWKALLWGGTTVRLRTALRQWLGPITLSASARHLQAVIDRVQPDLVHAMRIPYEGMIAALAHPDTPLLISVWGNDFTLHAVSNPFMRRLTRLTLQGAQALHTDCRRDQRLAYAWGFPAENLTIVLPGAGGIQTELFFPADEATAPCVINPRGFRAYLRNDTFFRSIPLVLRQRPEVRFICPSMAGDSRALRWLDELGIQEAVDLLPNQPRSQMGVLFRKAQVAVSPSTHDGTPNTLLEAMACGCFPIAGDIESIREWITPGVNGLLVDPADPQALAEAILQALADPEIRRRARIQNTRLIAEKAEYRRVMQTAEQFYRQILAAA